MIKVLRRVFVLSIIVASVYLTINKGPTQSKTLKLYWFIPDGLRNDQQVFDMFKWAQEGKLPNLKKMMDNGAYGYSIPDFPSHTPTNFATLLTGAHPDTHGISDGAIHVEGYPLNIVPIGGFRSNSKWVSPAWTIFEKNKLDTFLLSIPGSTPPEMSKGKTVRGRWGGWGADFYAINFQDSTDIGAEQFFDKSDRLFYNGPKLTEVVTAFPEKNTIEGVTSFSGAKEFELKGWDGIVYGHIHDSTNDQKVNYDKIAFSTDNKKVVSDIGEGEWSEWIPIILKWRTRDDFNLYTPQKSDFEKKYETVDIETQVKIRVIRLTPDGKFRVRLLFNILNNTLSIPENVSDDLNKNIGPMVDFSDNYPPQLVYYPEDKKTFIEEANMSLEWHKKAVSFIIKKYNPEVFIQDTYTPNQMLTSRWWTGYIDPKSKHYGEINDIEREKLWNEVKDMYQKIDQILGAAMDSADKDTLIVFSSDHGIGALDRVALLNNLFARKGWLTIKFDEERRIYDVDWNKTKVAFLENTNIYINPNGLGGNWKRGTGAEYEKLRNEVMDAVKNLVDTDGVSPLAKITKWEDADKEFGLPQKQAGDLVIANKIGYQWTEEVTGDNEIFKTPLRTGYKQGILADQENALHTTFAIMGPGVKKGFKIENPISNVDQLPTILKLMNLDIPEYIQGRVIQEVIEK